MSSFNIISELQDGRKIARVTALGRVNGGTTDQVIEMPGLRTIDQVISASIDGGYLVDPSDVTISGNKLTVQAYYFDYTAGASGVAIIVPNTVNLVARTITLVVIGY
jgi:hypothetical protein